MSSATTQTLGRFLRRGIPVVIGIGLILIILQQINFSAFQNIVLNADIPLLCLALFLSAANLVLGTVRWQLLLKHLDVFVPLSRLLHFVLQSIAVNLFVPGGVAGEFSRALSLHLRHTEAGPAYSSVITDKLLGLIGFLLLAMLAVILEWQKLWEVNIIWPVAVFGLILLIMTSALYSGRVSLAVTQRLQRLPAVQRISKLLTDNLQSYRRTPLILFKTLCIAIAAHMLQIICTWTIGVALGVELGFFTYLLYVPIIAVAAAVPISNSGIGVRETGFVLLLSIAGAEAESALAISLIFTAFALVIPGVFGLLSFSIISHRKAPDH